MKDRDFQAEAAKKLNKGQSVLIVAPTGLGKTKAALKPFVNENDCKHLLNTRLLYTLPLRALSKGVVDELKELSSTIQPTVHHGDKSESEVFSERAIITTVDQYFTAFAGAPLSWASHKSHAAAGAVLTSYSVFDEVHLLSPKTGLQLLFAILRLRQRWGLLSCVMTATMPESVANFCKEFCGLEIVEASATDINERDSWRKVDLQLLGEKTPGRGASKSRKQTEESGFEWQEKDPQGIAELVKEKWESWSEVGVDGPRKIIVFMNTVDRAIKVYEHLQGLCPHTLLAHSRFTREHREQVEKCVHHFFGKHAQDTEAILITTQVAEAGLNISAPLVITELSPMDSLIQRIGRCQRFKPPGYQKKMRGRVLIVKPSGQMWYAPYFDSFLVRPYKVNSKGRKKPLKSVSIRVIEITKRTLEHALSDGSNLCPLTWDKEAELVNQALSEPYEGFLSSVAFEPKYPELQEKPWGDLYDTLAKTSAAGEAEEEEEDEDEQDEEEDEG